MRAVAPDIATGTADWAWTQAAAGLVIALAAAPLGVLADRAGRRRAMLAGFTLVLVVAVALLWTIRPAHGFAARALILVGIATIAFEIAAVFYNAMLPGLAGPARMGRVSGLGWGAGYVGGLICLGACLVLLINPHPPLFGLDPHQAEPVRATAIFAAGWIAVFSWPVLLLGQGETGMAAGTALRLGLAELAAGFRRAFADPVLGRFLLARMLYTDGLTTLFAFGAIFAAGSFAMGTKAVLMLGIGLNVTAGIGAFGFAFIEDRIGARRAVMISLLSLLGLGVAVLAVGSVAWFVVLALALGVFIGPAQSASRSLMAHLAPAEGRNAHFGLFALSGRVTGFLGPAALGAVTAATGSQRAGMVVILVLLGSGAWLLGRLRLPAGLR